MSEPMELGVLIDPRSANQKEFDYKHEEVFTSSVPAYHSSKQQASQFVGQFPTDDQKSTSSCVAHGKVLVMSIFNYLQGLTPNRFVQLSSMFIYRNRVNYPGQGMIPSSANLQTVHAGAPIYADMPTRRSNLRPANGSRSSSRPTLIRSHSFPIRSCCR